MQFGISDMAFEKKKRKFRMVVLARVPTCSSNASDLEALGNPIGIARSTLVRRRHFNCGVCFEVICKHPRHWRMFLYTISDEVEMVGAVEQAVEGSERKTSNEENHGSLEPANLTHARPFAASAALEIGPGGSMCRYGWANENRSAEERHPCGET